MDPPSVDNGSSFPTNVRLDTLFLYQNNLTGQPSSTPLTVRQLCRILCPTTTATSSSSSALSTSVLRHLTADSNLLLQEPDGSYSSSVGWTPARNVPVIREAVIWWYYFCKVDTAATANGSSNGPTASSPAVSPAVSCRDLASIVKELGATTNICFSSTLTNSEWRTLDELDDLRTALEAFDDVALAPIESQSREAHLGTNDEADDDATDTAAADVERELEKFLQSTGGSSTNVEQQHDDDKEESYESDGGTRYYKDLQTGNWIHEALANRHNGALKRKRPDGQLGDNNPMSMPQLLSSSSLQSSRDASSAKPAAKRKQKKSKFSAKKGRCWIYVTGLPQDCTIDEIATTFAKAGLLDLDPETQRPKIKLYRYKESDAPENCTTSLIGMPKGDASICYARPESVELAVTLLDNTPFRLHPNGTTTGPLLTVQAAKFEQHGEEFEKRRNAVSNAKRKVAKLATAQAMDWDEGEFNGRLTGGRKGLHIVVLKHLFDSITLTQLSEEKQHDVLQALDDELREVCEEWGTVEKVTFFAKNPDGVAIVKFLQPGAASDAVRELEGRDWKGHTLAASFWDGVTDYTVKDEAAEATDSKVREEEFGNWLDNQKLPEELRLQTD
jgi:HIV Tat-specific factor 1